MNRFGYSEDQYDEIINHFNTHFWRGFEYWNGINEKHLATLRKYNKVFEEASGVAHNVDISDICDGFPCGRAHLYLAPEMRKEPLGKALAFFNDSYSSVEYKYQVPIDFPVCGQCVEFTERICGEVQKFLNDKGIETYMNVWID